MIENVFVFSLNDVREPIFLQRWPVQSSGQIKTKSSKKENGGHLSALLGLEQEPLILFNPIHLDHDVEQQQQQ